MSAGDSDSGWIYDCTVTHVRHVAPPTRFTYALFYLLVDIDRLQDLDRSLSWFSHNRFNLASFYDTDHGARIVGGLRPWAEQQLAQAGIALQGGSIRLLCLPRVLGWAFNPLSVWYCAHRDGSLRAVIAEVRNTFGERHSYVLHADGAPLDWSAVLAKEKVFHVSPFLDVAGSYGFRLERPVERLRLQIHESVDAVDVLDASLVGRRQPLRDRALLARTLRTPFVAAKVLAGIHWQAFLLWVRGAALRRKPSPPASQVS